MPLANSRLRSGALNRRSLLRIFGLGGAAAVGEAMPGIGNVWMYGGRAAPPMANAMMGSQVDIPNARQLLSGMLRADPMDVLVERAREIQREREDYTMTDWGGAL